MEPKFKEGQLVSQKWLIINNTIEKTNVFIIKDVRETNNGIEYLAESSTLGTSHLLPENEIVLTKEAHSKCLDNLLKEAQKDIADTLQTIEEATTLLKTLTNQVNIIINQKKNLGVFDN